MESHTVAHLNALADIEYRLFESDALWLDEHLDTAFHSIDNEILLRGADGRELYISWSRVPTEFCMSVARATHNKYDPPVLRRMNDDPLWSPLVGRAITVAFDDDLSQVLRLSTDAGEELFVCSYDVDRGGKWESDTIYVSRAVPDGRPS